MAIHFKKSSHKEFPCKALTHSVDTRGIYKAFYLERKEDELSDAIDEVVITSEKKNC